MPNLPAAISSGSLDRQIALQRKTTTKNDFGEPVETWVDLAIVWAQKLELVGGEQVRADEVAAQMSTTFVIRYTAFSPPLNPRDRLLYNEAGGPPEQGLVYNIRRVTEIGRRNGQAVDAWTRTDQVPGQG